MFKKFLLFFLFVFLVPALAQEIIATLQVEKKGDVDYVDGIDLGKKLKMHLLWKSEADILQIGASSWAWDNEWASIKDTSFLLQAPVQNKINGKKSFWLPLPSSLPVFEIGRAHV